MICCSNSSCFCCVAMIDYCCNSEKGKGGGKKKCGTLFPESENCSSKSIAVKGQKKAIHQSKTVYKWKRRKERRSFFTITKHHTNLLSKEGRKERVVYPRNNKKRKKGLSKTREKESMPPGRSVFVFSRSFFFVLPLPEERIIRLDQGYQRRALTRQQSLGKSFREGDQFLFSKRSFLLVVLWQHPLVFW